ncbi:formyltetrahydrofolate deformylase [Rickettsiales bacterium]|nr:formyltetrahydrofolate deformylase [Rickettsiales bacterium]
MAAKINRYILTLSCKDTTGIVAAVSGMLTDIGGFITESAQWGDISTKKFFMRTVFDTDKYKVDHIRDLFRKVADKFEMMWEITDTSVKTRVLLMASKQDHCLSDLLNRHSRGDFNAQIPAVISNHEDVQDMVKWYNIPFYYFPVSNENRKEQENQILQIIEKYNIDLTVLARYMQILSPDLLSKISCKAINIHHSFLPGFKGAKPYHQAFDKGVKIVGATAHYASNDLDEGPIIEQEIVRVNHTNTPEELLAIGRDAERIALFKAVKYHIERRILLNGNKTVVFS